MKKMINVHTDYPVNKYSFKFYVSNKTIVSGEKMFNFVTCVDTMDDHTSMGDACSAFRVTENVLYFPNDGI